MEIWTTTPTFKGTFRYLTEGLTEEQLQELDRVGDEMLKMLEEEETKAQS